MKNVLLITGVFIVVNFLNPLYGQKDSEPDLTSGEIKEYKNRVTGLVKYFENTLNFIGDPEAVPREKEIAISESYLKVFRDDKVQIEDDLDENRDVPLYKDVQAYLKDIRFFFRNATFTFRIETIEHFLNEENKHFFKVTYNRQLEAVTVSGDTIDSRKIRYMEVNLDREKNDLKIASIYTTKLNEKEEMQNWWNGLNTVWRNILGNGLMVFDTLELSGITYLGDSVISVKHLPLLTDSAGMNHSGYPDEPVLIESEYRNDTIITDTREIYRRLSALIKQKQIDIRDYEMVKSLAPLAKLTELKEINCSGTTVTDLVPVRNLNKLEFLDISNTPVEDLTPIRYSTSLKELKCSYTLIYDPEPIAGLTNLEILECSGLRISDLGFVADLKKLTTLECSETNVFISTPLRHLVQLRDLDISGTLISKLDFAKELIYLKYLDCEGTPVSDLDPLRNLEQLEILKISNTGVESLEPLESLENLKRIYWDSDDPHLINTKQRKERAIRFMDKHPGTLVIFETDELEREWKTMEKRWKDVIREAAGLSENPTKEELHKVIRIEAISLTEGKVESLKPLLRLYNLKLLNLSGVITEDYSPVGELIELQELNISHTAVQNLDFVSNLFNLKILRAENTDRKSVV